MPRRSQSLKWACRKSEKDAVAPARRHPRKEARWKEARTSEAPSACTPTMTARSRTAPSIRVPYRRVVESIRQSDRSMPEISSRDRSRFLRSDPRRSTPWRNASRKADLRVFCCEACSTRPSLALISQVRRPFLNQGRPATESAMSVSVRVPPMDGIVHPGSEKNALPLRRRERQTGMGSAEFRSTS